MMYTIEGKALICHEIQSGVVHEYPESFNFVSHVKDYPEVTAEQYVKREAERDGACILVVEIIEVTTERLAEPHDAIEQFINVE